MDKFAKLKFLTVCGLFNITVSVRSKMEDQTRSNHLYDIQQQN